MSYLDRLRTARYVSPSGREFEFEFDELSRTGDRKAAISEIPQSDDAIVQDLGSAATRYAITGYFSGADYDITADAFQAALVERGTGTLKHPRFGDITVLPLNYNQREAFVDGIGRATFTIEFVKSPVLATLESTGLTEAGIAADLDTQQDASSDAVGAQIDPVDAADEAKSKTTVTDSLASLSDACGDLVEGNEELSEDFNKQVNEIESGIDTLIGTPITLAQSFITVSRLPARAVISITQKIKGYSVLIDDLAAVDPLTDSQAALKALGLFGAVAGLAESALYGTLVSRLDAVNANAALAAALLAALAGIEAAEASVPTYQAPRELVAGMKDSAAAAAALLLAKAFALKSERKYTLTGDMCPLDLVYQLYGRLDDDLLDEFIETNLLAGDEIFAVPLGREVVYYV